ncbi:IS630 family transposase [Neochlamydia sp. S13]|uniref:IS630 family transposase n=1 Tax=Neochlamydia sp. S13 TaxID=1353976 RepID=UPI0005A7DACB|nr:IS630 family transposase [Neochlamydia sp. S13]BBI17577.1 Putative transposase [Neochlamydia sp. S13]
MKYSDARLLPPVIQQQLRHKAVDLFLNGKNTTEISKHLGVSRQAVYNWIKKHSESGKQGLKIHKRGRPKGTKLQPWQSAQIVNFIKNSCPDQLSLPFFLWTRESVGLLIWNKFNIKLSKWTVGRYLATWGFSPQKPARRAIEQNPKAIEEWFKIEYPSIQKLSKKENATIYWGDEMGLRSDHNVGRTYGLKGKTPVVKRTGNRFSCNMISALTNLGKLNFMVFHENFTSEIFLKFLKRIIRQCDRKVFLIVDQHRAHKSKIVKNWLTKNKEHIRLYYLPSYCPELNPDEFLNQDENPTLGSNDFILKHRW